MNNVPPLFYAVSGEFLPEILSEGLQHEGDGLVRLSDDIEKAATLGGEHRTGLVILEVDTEAIGNTIEFIKRGEQWLTSGIPSRYLSVRGLS